MLFSRRSAPTEQAANPDLVQNLPDNIQTLISSRRPELTDRSSDHHNHSWARKNNNNNKQQLQKPGVPERCADV